ncbi:AMP-binding protein, partial [Listeria innocua]|uniref:condensation domain-containing protein n=1 Tax=Listeria innocua TaxID=1642 RepID=UPI001623E0C7
MEKIDTSNIQIVLPLTPMQEGMFYHYKEDTRATAYSIQNEFLVKEDINLKNFRQAVVLLQKKHEILRMTINDEVLDNVVQIIWKNVETNFIQVDSKADWQQVLTDDLNESFDLKNGPLFRIKIQENKGNNHILVSFHHIILDGWSTGLVYQDLLCFYNQICRGVSEKYLIKESIKEKKGNYHDYVHWMIEQDKQQGLEHWKNLLANYENVAEIKPMNYQPTKHSQAVSRASKNCSIILNQKLENQLKNLGVTHSTLMEMAWGLLLQNYSGSKDVVFGKVVSGREVPILGIEQMVGLFINTVPVRLKDENYSLSELLVILQEQNNRGVPYSVNSLTDIQEHCELHKDFIKTIVVFENYYVENQSVERQDLGLQWELVNGREETNYGLALSSYLGEGNRLSFDITYQNSEYGIAEIEQMLAHLEMILDQFVSQPSIKVSELKRITYKEHDMVCKINQIVKDPMPRATFKELFELIVKTYPENKAIIAGNQLYSYQTINEKANRVANWILSQGYDSKAKIGIMADRSTESVIHILGIIKSGHCLVIFDPKGPIDRNQYMIDNCAIQLMFTFEWDGKVAYDQKIIGSIVEENTTNPAIQVCGSDPLCIIHTSGTTGHPKGVIIRNDSIENVKEYQKSAFDLTEKDVVMQIANFIFDAFIWELVMSLLNGAALVLTSDEERTDSAQLGRLIDIHGGSIATVPPVILDQNIYEAKSMERLISVGSEFPSSLLKKVPNTIRLFNAYGPTEGTICTSIWERNSADMARYQKAPIGKPVKNMAVYIEQDGQLCGIGMPGEILIGGDGVSAGYL